MPDITMCDLNGSKCRKSKTCYRVLATPSYWQSWGKFNPNNCEYYIKATKSVKRDINKDNSVPSYK